jgi:hypothetical protein
LARVLSLSARIGGGALAALTLIAAGPAAAARAAAPTSINSTSQNDGAPSKPVRQAKFKRTRDFQILAVNDLGMHCGDLDTRVASILPPFNVLHAVVLRKGAEPVLLGPQDVDVVYSATANPSDPASARASTSFVFKTNFWETVAKGAYDPFYPPSVTPPSAALTPDLGLPVPDTAELYLGSGGLVVHQQAMPGINGVYVANVPQSFTRFDRDLPFFVGFPFGYTVEGANWFAADGIPISTFDDSGRVNPYPLMRAQARAKSGNRLGQRPGKVLATVDTVVPVSGEADCRNCHAALEDGGSGVAIGEIQVAVSTDDPQHGAVPDAVSVEWATDVNILRLHDRKHRTSLARSALELDRPIVCQTCHYSPALDLAQVGPKGGVAGEDPDANGRTQRVHKTMSRVMHATHGAFRNGDGSLLFASMPAPVDARTGAKRDPALAQARLEGTCYQCHPGKETRCLRGAMGAANVVCQDCHGGMEQVGNDFSRDLSVARPFPGGADLSRRVPWASEPGCQSCHTGDAVSNLAGTAGTLVNPTDRAGNPDGIRLLQAFRTTDAAAATPIVASNRRFAEDVAGNGKRVLYRFSTGHGGVLCEGCHGSTHAEWPNASPVANDNITAKQLQGHVGTVVECGVCHSGSMRPNLDGPHGMHPVGREWAGGHEDFAERNLSACMTCHGADLKGTVLSRALADRTFSGLEDAGTVSFRRNQIIGCGHCHENPLSGDGDGDGDGRGDD